MADIVGTDESDILVGTPENDSVLGAGGDDIIDALSGGDSVQGGTGDDTISGGPDADRVYGDNRIRGPLLPAANAGGEPGPGNNLISAGGGSDIVYAGYGTDTVFGDDGNDTLIGSGSYDVPFGEPFLPPDASSRFLFLDGPDLVAGGAGNDFLYGGIGEDTLLGGEGDDTLGGGFGADVLSGGPGADRFSVGQQALTSPPFSSEFGQGFLGEYFPAGDVGSGVGPGNRDVITDFEQGSDRFDLNPFVAGGLDILAELSAFLGTRPFQPVESLPFNLGLPTPQIRYFVEGDSTVVQLYAPSRYGRDGAADAEFELTGVYALTPADFGGIRDFSEGEAPPPPPPPPPAEVDWNALAAKVLANFAATGQWYL